MADIQDRPLNFYVIILFIIFSPPVYKSTRSVCLSVGRAAKEYLIYTFFVFIILSTEHLLFNCRLSSHDFVLLATGMLSSLFLKSVAFLLHAYILYLVLAVCLSLWYSKFYNFLNISLFVSSTPFWRLFDWLVH